MNLWGISLRWNTEQFSVLLYTPLTHLTSYRRGPEQQKWDREEAAQIVNADVSEPAVKELAPHILPVHKTDESLCFCVDLCRLNAISVRNC